MIRFQTGKEKKKYGVGKDILMAPLHHHTEKGFPEPKLLQGSGLSGSSGGIKHCDS